MLKPRFLFKRLVYIFLLFFVIFGLLYNINNNQKVNAPQDFDHILKDMERLVHIDLKGAPPKPDYFKKFIPFLIKHGASGLLL